VSRPYPEPPHLVAGFVVPDRADVLRELTDAVREVGPADDSPLLLEIVEDGVELTLSGDLVGMPPWVELEPEERDAAERTQRFLRAAFEAAAERLDPLYAGVDLEWRIPPPARLAAEESRLPGDLLWSASLDARDPDLAGDLERIFGAPSRPLARGRAILAGGLLDPATPVEHPSLTAGRAAAARLARACQRSAAGHTIR
jgi:hypothetical protein